MVLALLLFQTTFKDLYVKYLPTINFDVDSGYISLKGEEDSINQMFYQLVYKQGVRKGQVAQDQQLVIWLSGGPGCASQGAIYGYIGPFIVASNEQKEGDFIITLNPQSWNQETHLLLIDQPLGTGFSYSTQKEIISSTEMASKSFTDFMIQFFDTYTEFQNISFYIFGDSYGGHTVPGFAAHILADAGFQKYAHLYKGIGIGDGFTSALNQAGRYASFLYSAGLVDDSTRLKQIQTQGQIQNLILKGELEQATILQDKIIDDFSSKMLDFNVFNFQKYVYTSEKNQVDLFLQKYKGEYMKVPQDIYNTGCNQTIYEAFVVDQSIDYSPQVAFLITKGKVLIYSGQVDFIVNTPGQQDQINRMIWSDLSAWKKTKKQIFKLNANTVGTYKSYKSFTFAVIYQAGHMTPMDQPEVAYAMFKHYLNDDQEWK